MGNQDTRSCSIEVDAYDALQEAAESLLVERFQKAQKCAANARRKTVMVKDMKLTDEIGGLFTSNVEPDMKMEDPPETKKEEQGPKKK